MNRRVERGLNRIAKKQCFEEYDDIEYSVGAYASPNKPFHSSVVAKNTIVKKEE
jgi:hypothetical protein